MTSFFFALSQVLVRLWLWLMPLRARGAVRSWGIGAGKVKLRRILDCGGLEEAARERRDGERAGAERKQRKANLEGAEDRVGRRFEPRKARNTREPEWIESWGRNGGGAMGRWETKGRSGFAAEHRNSRRLDCGKESPEEVRCRRKGKKIKGKKISGHRNEVRLSYSGAAEHQADGLWNGE